MKQVFNGLILALLVVGLASCSKDDVTPSGGNEIPGNWKLVSYTYTGTGTTTFAGTTTNTDYSAVGKNLNSFLEFKENPNKYSSMGSFDLELTITTGGQTTTSTYPFSGDFDEGTWEKNDNTLLIANKNGEMIEGTITELSENSLKLRYEFSTTDTQNGITTVQNVDVRQSYERQ